MKTNCYIYGLFLCVSIILLSGCEKEKFIAPKLIETGDRVIHPPAGFDPFYKKYINANGIPIVGSAHVEDEAFVRARHTVINMMAKRPDVLAQMIFYKFRMGIIADCEKTTDLPEYADANYPEMFSERARGYSGNMEKPFCSFAEENVMRNKTLDKWYGEDILIHELAHGMHRIALVNVIPDFEDKLEELYRGAMAKGLWKNTYAATNKEEYFAEAV